jgi:hypothetical protein
MAREPLRDCTLGRGIGEAGGSARKPTRESRPSTAVSAPDTNQAFAIRPLYVLPQDGPDHSLATNGTISRSVAAMQQWFAEQTGGTRLRFLAGAVATVRIGETGAQIARRGQYVRDRVEELLQREGYDDPYRLYAVWYDGTSTFSCGGGAWPPKLPGHVAALYLNGPNCSQDPFSSDGTTAKRGPLTSSMRHSAPSVAGCLSLWLAQSTPPSSMASWDICARTCRAGRPPTTRRDHLLAQTLS